MPFETIAWPELKQSRNGAQIGPNPLGITVASRCGLVFDPASLACSVQRAPDGSSHDEF